MTQEEGTGNILFDFAGNSYVCECETFSREDFPPINFILIHDALKQGLLTNSDYIQLSPWSAEGGYEIIDHKIYLYYEAGERLLEALGCDVEIDLDTHTVKISN